MSEPTETAELFAVIEMLGHRVVAGRVQECKRFGVEGTLIDVPAADGSPAWQTFVAGSAIYAVTPCSQAQALAYIQRNFQRPPQYLQLPAPAPDPAEREELADDTAFLRRLIDELEAVLQDPGAYVECAGRRLSLDAEADVYAICERTSKQMLADPSDRSGLSIEAWEEIARTSNLEQALIQLQPSEPEAYAEDDEEYDDGPAEY